MGEFNVDKSTGNLKLTAGADNYTTISYANWLTLTDEQKENGRWDVVGVPANEGYTEADKCMMSDGTTSVEDAFNNLNGFLNPVGFNVTLNTNKVNFADGTDGNNGANICLKFPSLKIALMSVSLNISSTLSDTDISVPFTLPKNVRVNFNAQGNITFLPYISYEGKLIGAGNFPTGQVKIFAIFRYSNT